MISHIPNIVKVFRIICLSIFVVATIEQNFIFAFYGLLTASLPDVFSGLIAKGFNLQSRLSAWLGPLVEKRMLFGMLSMTTYFQWLSRWFFACTLARDLMIVILAMALRSLVFYPGISLRHKHKFLKN